MRRRKKAWWERESHNREEIQPISIFFVAWAEPRVRFFRSRAIFWLSHPTIARTWDAETLLSSSSGTRSHKAYGYCWSRSRSPARCANRVKVSVWNCAAELVAPLQRIYRPESFRVDTNEGGETYFANEILRPEGTKIGRYCKRRTSKVSFSTCSSRKERNQSSPFS